MAKAISIPVAEPVPPAVAPAPALPLAGRAGPLLLAVLVGGMASMALEMTASRLLAPHFGSSLFIWANLIGLVMVYFTAGYFLGGRLADRAPQPRLLYGLIAAAGLATALIPGLAGPVLRFAENFPTPATSTDFGSLIAIVGLFLVPLTLLGCVSPFAIRLRTRGVRAAGTTAGGLYALATLGSIAGTFLPVFVLLPYLGIAVTLYLAGGALLVVAAIGWLSTWGAPTARGSLPEAARIPAPERGGARRPVSRFLLLIVAICGMSSLALEMTASQLLRPYFGSSLFIWANLIGLVLIYLTVGYTLGGRLADRYPSERLLYSLIAVAGLSTALIPLLARPLLTWSLEGFAQVSVSIFYGSLAGVIGLFAIPVILLGCISPFAIRLWMPSPGAAGEAAGAIYAVSTLGSIAGTFIPVFLLLPTIGSGRTLYMVAGALLIAAALGLLVGKRPGARLVAAALLGVAALGLLPPPALIKPPPYGQMLAERESVYNYIQVVGLDNGDVHLVLNEGHAVHSIYRADAAQPLTGGPWDYWLIAPYVNAQMRPADVQSMLMLGSAAGTASELFTRVYGPRPVDNVEIDPDIVALGRQYFHLPEAGTPGDTTQVHNIIHDARAYLRTTTKKYTIVGIDAYRQPYIPFHLTT
ncbi:MAG TPA: fused MFS/spermidine synthase, partial [Chloroflexia bacterium]|nr:fused MFS/spermidine synthase [Chloroflexia bacterium]